MLTKAPIIAAVPNVGARRAESMRTAMLFIVDERHLSEAKVVAWADIRTNASAIDGVAHMAIKDVSAALEMLRRAATATQLPLQS